MRGRARTGTRVRLARLMACAALGFAKRPRAGRRLFQKPLSFSTFLYFILLYSTFDGASIGPISRSGRNRRVTHGAGEVPPVSASTARLDADPAPRRC